VTRECDGQTDKETAKVRFAIARPKISYSITIVSTTITIVCIEI